MYDFNEYELLNEIIQERKEKARPSVERLNTSQETKYNDWVKTIHRKKSVKKHKK